MVATINPDLARIEIAQALTAIHNRFAALVSDKYSKTVERSCDLLRCDDLERIDSVVQSYRYFMDQLIENSGDVMVHNAARQCAVYARELVSISRLATSFPESASRRAKNLLQTKYQNRRTI